MYKNIKLVIEYDGTDYHGWQRQKDLTTIQETLESAVGVMTGEAVSVTGSGRTDAGVHALGQVANFRVDTKLTPEVFKKGLNSLLPPDIVIRDAGQVTESFHSRYDCKWKRYEYHILNCEIRSPLCRRFSWYIRMPLDLCAMRKALCYLAGEHDFSAFEATGSFRRSRVRNILDTGLRACKDGRVIFEISANGFLRYMVRNIVGTLADVGRGRITHEEFYAILQSKNRSNAGVTAPPQGLFLAEVCYNETLTEC